MPQMRLLLVLMPMLEIERITLWQLGCVLTLKGKNSIALGYRARVQDESQNSTFLNGISNGKNKDHYKGNNSLALGLNHSPI